MESLFYGIMTKITKWLDPKLEKFRPKKVEIPFTPETEKEFKELLKRTPHTILSAKDRKAILGLLSAKILLVSDCMVAKKDMIFVKIDEKLDPVILNRLYKSGARHFPVTNNQKQICGILHADIFDVDKVSEDNAIERYMDEDIVYLRDDYTAEMAMAALLRSNATYALVLDNNMRIRGSLSLVQLIAKILGGEIKDNFTEDYDAIRVANREK